MGLVELLTIIKNTYRPISGENSFLISTVTRMLADPQTIINVRVPGNIIRVSDGLLTEYLGSPDPKVCDEAIVKDLGRDAAIRLVGRRNLPEHFSPSDLGKAVHQTLFAEMAKMAHAFGKGETIEL